MFAMIAMGITGVSSWLTAIGSPTIWPNTVAIDIVSAPPAPTTTL